MEDHQADPRSGASRAGILTGGIRYEGSTWNRLLQQILGKPPLLRRQQSRQSAQHRPTSTRVREQGQFSAVNSLWQSPPGPTDARTSRDLAPRWSRPIQPRKLLVTMQSGSAHPVARRSHARGAGLGRRTRFPAAPTSITTKIRECRDACTSWATSVGSAWPADLSCGCRGTLRLAASPGPVAFAACCATTGSSGRLHGGDLSFTSQRNVNPPTAVAHAIPGRLDPMAPRWRSFRGTFCSSFDGRLIAWELVAEPKPLDTPSLTGKATRRMHGIWSG